MQNALYFGVRGFKPRLRGTCSVHPLWYDSFFLQRFRHQPQENPHGEITKPA